MKGNIYTRQKCQICGSSLVNNEKRNGCFCKKHPDQQATGRFYMKFGNEINKSFKDYNSAARYLTGLRYENDRGTYDVRDHLGSKPLSFTNLADKYLTFKEQQNLVSFYHIKRFMFQASRYFRDTNVKNIKRRHIRDFLDTLDVSDKTKKNTASQLHDFFYNYLYEEQEILTLAQLPKFPKIECELGFRKLIDIETREKIVDKIREDTYSLNPKIWLGIDMLCSYGKIRPIDLRRLKEGDFDLEYGFMTIWRPSKSKMKKSPKVVSIKLLDYHIDEIKKVKAQFPATNEVFFFRHTEKSRFPNVVIGKDYLYRVWKKACEHFGIFDLDLYGGTRHSSTTAIGKILGKKKAKDFSGHDTNQAFDRYCQIGEQDDFEITKIMAKTRGKIAPLKMIKKN